MLGAPSDDSPPTPSAAALARRRSQSRGSSSGNASSFRASLGGKAIGPRYGKASHSSRREGSAGSLSAGGSAFSDGNESGDNLKGFGSFSATREELRDGQSLAIFPEPSRRYRSDWVLRDSALDLSDRSAVAAGVGMIAAGKLVPRPTEAGRLVYARSVTRFACN